MTQASKQSFQTLPKTIITMADDDNQIEDNSEKVKRKRGCDTHTKTESSDIYILTKAAKEQLEYNKQEPDSGSFDKMNISGETRASTQYPNRYYEPLDSSKSDAHVPISKLQLRIVNVRIPVEGGEIVQERVVLAYDRLPEQQEQHCYDLDIGFRMHCPLLTRTAYDKPFEHSNTTHTLLVLRKRYLKSIVSLRQCAYPDSLAVEGAVYAIHHGDLKDPSDTPSTDYCYGFLSKVGSEALERRISIQKVEIAAPHSAASNMGIALVIVEGPVLETRTDRPQERIQQALRALLVPSSPQSSFHPLGGSLWDPPYGEVYCGARLHWRESEQVFVLRSTDDALAVKVVRHPSDLWGRTAPIRVHTDCGSRRGNLARIHHNYGADPAAVLTSHHLAGYFEEQCCQGRNENVMREVEIMAHIQRAVQADESSAVLSRRFLYLTEAAISEDNLFIATEFLPFNSLASYMGRKGQVTEQGQLVCAFNRDLTEACVRHVLRQLLEALVFLHDRGIAHQDISIENVALRVSTADKNSELARKCKIFLSTEEFLRLEVVLIDMGHVGMHAPCIGSASLQNAQLNSSSTTVNTATTSESSCSAESGNPCQECTAAPINLPILLTRRDFQLRKSGRFPVGKRSYWAPELSPELDYHGDGKGPLGRAYCGMCVDMWQLGVLAVYLRTGRVPVSCDDMDQSGGGLLRRVLTWYGQSKDQVLRDRAVAVRVSKTQVESVRLHQCFSNEGWDLVSKLLSFRPEDRISARDALQHPWFSLQPDSKQLRGELLAVARQVYAAAAAANQRVQQS